MKSRSARKIHRLFDRCGVNVGVSNVLMAGAVIALGFAVFYWLQQRSLDAKGICWADACLSFLAVQRVERHHENK